MNLLKSLKKIQKICEKYLNANEYEKNGTEVYSTDEMTGIQALERKYPDKPIQPKKPALHEFEYIRHGTTSLIAFLRISDGKIYCPYLNKTRNEVDFCTAIENVIMQNPNKKYIFICDGLNTHKSESLVKHIAEKCKINDDLGVKGKNGILKNLQTREQFLSNPEHNIHFIYTPKHSSWVNQIEIWFGIINRKLLKKSSYVSVVEMAESILKFIDQYNLTAKSFNWRYSG